MATLTASHVAHGTLTAATVDTVTLTAGASSSVEVLNRSTDYVYFTIDGTAPAVATAESYVVTPGGAVRLSVPIATSTVVKLISAVAGPYSVTAI